LATFPLAEPLAPYLLHFAPRCSIIFDTQRLHPRLAGPQPASTGTTVVYETSTVALVALRAWVS
jgi:hypothetical protein